MGQIVDARGLACPQPVINARKALETSDTIVMIVDNMTAVENLRRMATSLQCVISEENKQDGYYLTITRTSAAPVDKTLTNGSTDISSASKKSGVLLISQDVMGNGDAALGKILIRSFFHTIAENPPAPETIIFFNTGVRLVAEGSEVLEDIKALEKNGTKIFSCGTCLDYFKIKDKVKAGIVSNMYDIKEIMLGGSSVISL